jgi:hypothetical protein
MSRTAILDDEGKRSLVEEWDRSGLSADEFASAQKMNVYTLRAWGRAIRGPLPRGRRSRTRPVTRRVDFVEVSSTAPTPAAAQPRIELILPTGTRVLVFVDWTPELCRRARDAFSRRPDDRCERAHLLSRRRPSTFGPRSIVSEESRATSCARIRARARSSSSSTGHSTE